MAMIRNGTTESTGGAPDGVASEGVIRGILEEVLKGSPVRVWLFGSRARGDARPLSDWDLFLQMPEGGAVPPDLLARLAEALEASVVPCFVDLVDGARASEGLREKVRKEGVLWRDW